MNQDHMLKDSETDYDQIKSTIINVGPSEVPVIKKVDESQMAKSKKWRIITYFCLWFSLSVGYNIFNKKAVNKMKLPWLIATSQMFCGIPLITVMWLTGIRKMPKISRAEAIRLLPLAMFVSGAHMCGVMAMFAGSVSFAQIIKSGEPLFTAFLSIILLKEVLSWKVYITLIPVIVGVALTSVSEPSLSWLAFFTAMGANMFSALRGVYSKIKMNNPIGTNVDARNLYGILTIMSFLIMFPIALIVEGSSMVQTWETAADTINLNTLMLHVVLSGLCYYSYNEVSFATLELVSPVTHAVGSTFKRVFIIVASVIIFKNYPDWLGYFGMSVAIFGVGVYSLAKTMFKTQTTQDLIRDSLDEVGIL